MKKGEWIFIRQIAVFATGSEHQPGVTHLVRWIERVCLVNYSQVLWEHLISSEV